MTTRHAKPHRDVVRLRRNHRRIRLLPRGTRLIIICYACGQTLPLPGSPVLASDEIANFTDEHERCAA